MSSYPYSTSSHSHQHQKQDQRVITDQNYSNNILMMVLSTLESLENKYKEMSPHQSKKYSYYDKVDYSGKSAEQLQRQLQSQIFCYYNSKKMFQQDHPGKYKLPSKFNQQKVVQEIKYYHNIFQKYNDLTTVKMIQDLYNSLIGAKEPPTINSSIYKKYSQTQQRNFNKNIIDESNYCSQQIAKEQESIKKSSIQRQEDLPVFVNPIHKHGEHQGFKARQEQINRRNQHNPKNNFGNHTSSKKPY